MEAPTGPQMTQTPWLIAVMSLIPLTAAIARDDPRAEPGETYSDVLLDENLTELQPRLEAPDPVEPHRILVIGDSHTAGTFGRSLDLLLRTLPASEVTTVGSCGLSPDGFLESKGTRCGYLKIDGGELAFRKRQVATPNINSLLSRHKPDLTIVELGANQINTALRDPIGAADDIRRLANKVLSRSSRCLWVGPPYGASAKKPPERIDHVYEVLSSALPEGCAFIDSRPSAMPHLAWNEIVQNAGRRGDGKHYDSLGVYGQHASRLWAMAVFGEARALLKQPRPVLPASVVFAESVLVAAY